MPKQPKSDAALYLLTMLLQRVDSEKPGVIDALIADIEADRDAVGSNETQNAYAMEVIDEALATLSHARGE